MKKDYLQELKETLSMAFDKLELVLEEYIPCDELDYAHEEHLEQILSLIRCACYECDKLEKEMKECH